MFTDRFSLVAKSSILKVPEYYPNFASTGLPNRPRLATGFKSGIPIPANRYTEMLSLPLAELGAFAKMLNLTVNDHLNSVVKDLQYRLFSRLDLDVVVNGGKINVSPTVFTLPKTANETGTIKSVPTYLTSTVNSPRGISEASEIAQPETPVVTDCGLEKIGLTTIVPPPLKVEDFVLKRVSDSRFDFGWLILGRPHWLAEPLFEEVCHRDCAYIWHKVGGYITIENGKAVVKAGFSGSRFPSHALFINAKRVIQKPQGQLGNLWISNEARQEQVK